jgi:hypothetical protein
LATAQFVALREGTIRQGVQAVLHFRELPQSLIEFDVCHDLTLSDYMPCDRSN